MAIAIRVIVYEGPDEAVQQQLGRSLADGVREYYGGPAGRLRMTIATLPSALMLAAKRWLTALDLVEHSTVPDEKTGLSDATRRVQDHVAGTAPYVVTDAALAEPDK